MGIKNSIKGFILGLLLVGILSSSYANGGFDEPIIQGKSFSFKQIGKFNIGPVKSGTSYIEHGFEDVSVYYMLDKDPDYDYILIVGTSYSRVLGFSPLPYAYVGPNIDDEDLGYVGILIGQGKIIKYGPKSINTVKASKLHVSGSWSIGGELGLSLKGDVKIPIGKNKNDYVKITPESGGKIYVNGGGSYNYDTECAQYHCRISTNDYGNGITFKHEWLGGEANANAICKAEQSAYFPFFVIVKIPQVSNTKYVDMSFIFGRGYYPFLIHDPLKYEKCRANDIKLEGCSYYALYLKNSPPKISLKSPKDGETFSNIYKVTLKWRGYDPDGGEITYEVYVGESKYDLEKVTETTNSEYVLNVEPGKKYYWKVVAIGDHGLRKESPIWSFEVFSEGTLKVSSNPSGAKIYIDGKYVGKTPDCIELSPGTHKIKLKKDYCKEIEDTIYIEAGKTLEKHYDLPIKVEITGTPSGAKVYIDGSNKGYAPLTVYLKEGSHRIKISKDGYETKEERFEVSYDNRKYRYELEPLQGKLVVKTKLDYAKVYIDGCYKGRADKYNPLEIELKPGTYRVTLKTDGYKDYTATIDIKSEETKTLNDPREPKGVLIIKNDLDISVKVEIDNRYYTISSHDAKEISLPPGAYTIRFETKTKYGELKKSDSITIESGKTKTINTPPDWEDIIKNEKEAEDKINEAGRIISEYKHKGAILKEAEEKLREAKSELNRGNYDLAKRYAEESMELADKLYNKYKECKDRIDDISDKLNNAKSKLNNIKNSYKHIDLNEEENKLSEIENSINRAKSKMNNGEYDEALSYLEGLESKIDEVIKSVEQKKQEWESKYNLYNNKKQNILNRINEVKNKYKEIDLTDVENLINTAENRANSGDIDGALSYLDEANSKIDEAINRFEERKKEIMEKINSLREENNKEGYNYESVSNLLDEAEKYLNNGELSKAEKEYNKAYNKFLTLADISNIIQQSVNQLNDKIDKLTKKYEQQQKIDKILKRKYIKELNKLREELNKILSTKNKEKIDELESKIKEIENRINTNSKLIVGREIDERYAKELKESVVYNMDISDIGDCVIVGGPVANKICKKYMDYFPVSITNEYPGRNRGVIQKAEIDGYTAILLAGSDRWGTKAAVEYAKQLNDIPDEPIFVEWRDGKAVRIEKP